MHVRHRSRTLASLSPNQALITAAVLAALAAEVPAQLQFEELPGRELPVDTDDTNAVALGDIDGDGDLDAVFGNGYYSGQQNRLFLNDGTGTFTDATATNMPVDNDFTNAVALGDVDGDGDLDIVFGNLGQNTLYLNDGSGTFTDATATNMPVDNDSTNAVALGDVDGDGDLDFVSGNGDSFFNTSLQNQLYLNNGSGTFARATATQMPAHTDATGAIVLGDVDGDGDLDLALGNLGFCIYTGQSFYCYGQQNKLYLNDGTGTFTDATPFQMPGDRNKTTAVALGDVDVDGDLDMVLGNSYPYYGSFFSLQNQLYLNDGTGTFTIATATNMPVDADQTSTAVLADVDGDSDLDIVFGSGDYSFFGQNKLYLNNGGTFSDDTARLPTATNDTRALALGDVDGDGDLDIVFGNIGQNHLYLNLQRQLDTPLPAVIGQPYTFDVYARYGPPRQMDVALTGISPRTAQVPWPPFGTLGIDPAIVTLLPLIVVPQPSGLGSFTTSIPNNTGLVGLTVHAQALLVQSPTTAFLTNVTSDQIQ